MKTSNITLALGLATIGIVASSPTLNAAGCSSYGNTAKIQQRENTNRGCGFSGQLWHTNNYAHKIFCMAVGEDNANYETAVREDKLQSCRMAEAAERFEENEVSVDNNPGWFADNEFAIGGWMDNEHVSGRFSEVEPFAANE